MLSPEMWQKLLAYTEDIHSRERELLVKNNVTDTELTLGAFASFVEEVGEFGSEIRKQMHMCYNRKKVEEAQLEDVYLEGMDVLISLLIVLKRFPAEGNLDGYLEEKIAKNRARGY